MNVFADDGRWKGTEMRLRIISLTCIDARHARRRPPGGKASRAVSRRMFGGMALLGCIVYHLLGMVALLPIALLAIRGGRRFRAS